MAGRRSRMLSDQSLTTQGGVDLLRFTTLRRNLDIASEAGTAGVFSGGRAKVIAAGQLLTELERDFLKSNRTARASLNRTMKNIARRAKQKLTKRTRQLDLIDTRTFISAWKVSTVTGPETGGLRLNLKIENLAPYAVYVHPKGTAASRTFINTDLPKIVDEVTEETIEDLARDLEPITTAALAQAAVGALGG